MKPRTLWKVIRFSVTAAVLFTVWLLFIDGFTVFSIAAGAAGALLISGLTYNVFIAEHEASANALFPNPFWLAVFFAVLVYYLYASSIRMLAAVLTGKASPRIVHFRTRLKSDFARMVLSNSITFTPGTITLDLNDDHLTVHWFFCNTHHAKAAGEAVKGRMEPFLRRVWS